MSLLAFFQMSLLLRLSQALVHRWILVSWLPFLRIFFCGTAQKRAGRHFFPALFPPLAPLGPRPFSPL